MQTDQRDAFLGVAGAAVAACVMLAWAAAGHPPYAFYSWLKVVVAGCSAYAVYAIWRFAPRLMALGLLVIGFGALILYGKMHRQQWIPFDWAGAILFGVLAAVMGYVLLSQRAEP